MLDIEDVEYPQDLPSTAPAQEEDVPKWEFKPRRNPKWGVVEVRGLVVGRGSNQKVINPDEVYRLASYGSTVDEMSDWFQINRETLKYNFMPYIEKGWAEVKHKLRRKQIQVALEGHPTMLIWLGKQLLGQQETPTNSQANAPLPWTDSDLPQETTAP
jgi:hypothetical protein